MAPIPWIILLDFLASALAQDHGVLLANVDKL